MAFGELTQYEKRNVYYTGIQLGKDVQTQIKIISDASRAMLAAQAMSANAIITSQERILSGIDDLAYGIDQVIEGIYGLKAAFEFGISEVVWQIEQNRTVLKSILEVLMAPLDTQAKELKKRAEDAYANGWYEDALEDFTESEKKNKYDFSVHISIGMIYLFHLIDRDKALVYFEQAARYAKPKSAYHASFALLHAALIKRDQNKIEDAERFTTEAIELSPDFAEALYQNAQLNAQLKNAEKCIYNLEKAISIDRNYCLKANSDEMFNPVRNEVNALFERLRNEVVAKVEHRYHSLTTSINKITEILNRAGRIAKDIKKYSTNAIYSELSDVKKMLDRKSYFDGLDAQVRIQSISDKVRQYYSFTSNFLRDTIRVLDREIHCHISNSEEKKESNGVKGATIGAIIGFLMMCIVAWINKINVVGVNDDGKSLFLLMMSFFLPILIGYLLGKYIAKQSNKTEKSPEVNEQQNKITMLEEEFKNLHQISLT